MAGMVLVMDGPETGPFNIGNPTEFTMLELAHLVKEVANPDVDIVYKENTADDPTRRKPDITKVPRQCAWMSPACCNTNLTRVFEAFVLCRCMHAGRCKVRSELGWYVAWM